jgi:hypothetical protein
LPISKVNRNVIEAAIIGFEHQKTQIDNQIAELRSVLTGPAGIATTSEAPTAKRKKVSAVARQRMALAQKARWAKIRGEAEPRVPTTPEAPKAKRKLSAAAKAKLVANLKKARSAKAAKAKAAATKKTV